MRGKKKAGCGGEGVCKSALFANTEGVCTSKQATMRDAYSVVIVNPAICSAAAAQKAAQIGCPRLLSICVFCGKNRCDEPLLRSKNVA